jgi:hypothetical protein
MTTIEFNKLNNHIGYGNPNAEIVFMGLEEGCAAGTIAANYNYRFKNLTGSCLEDLKAFHLKSTLGDMSKWFVGKGKMQRTWANYIKLLLNYSGVKSISPKSILNFQLKQLGQPSSNNALIEFYPFPRPSHGYWNNALLDIGSVGITESTYKINNPNNDRIDLIRNVTINNGNLKALIITGSLSKNKVKNEYRAIISTLGLKLGVDHSLDVKNNGSIIYAIEYKSSNGKKVFFTPFFGNGAITDKAIAQLASII